MVRKGGQRRIGPTKGPGPSAIGAFQAAKASLKEHQAPKMSAARILRAMAGSNYSEWCVKSSSKTVHLRRCSFEALCSSPLSPLVFLDGQALHAAPLQDLGGKHEHLQRFSGHTAEERCQLGVMTRNQHHKALKHWS